MEPILDCKNRVACMCNPATGLVETKYKNFKAQAKIPIGEEFTIEREGIKTVITRLSPAAFEVKSYENLI